MEPRNVYPYSKWGKRAFSPPLKKALFDMQMTSYGLAGSLAAVLVKAQSE